MSLAVTALLATYYYKASVAYRTGKRDRCRALWARARGLSKSVALSESEGFTLAIDYAERHTGAKV